MFQQIILNCIVTGGSGSATRVDRGCRCAATRTIFNRNGPTPTPTPVPVGNCETTCVQ